MFEGLTPEMDSCGFVIFEPAPAPAGYWKIGQLSIAVFVKPTDEQIANTIQMFGWEWRDNGNG